MLFVRSGRVSTADGWIRALAGFGRLWSSYASGLNTVAYNLALDTTTVDSSSGPNARYFGFPLRCLSTVLGM